MNYETAKEIEIAISDWFGIVNHIIVPNVSWGMFRYECDLVALSSSNYAYEIEIKISKYDLFKDRLKRHNHDDWRIRKLWFAIPEKLSVIQECIQAIPDRSGILVVQKNGHVTELRQPKINESAQPLSDTDRFKLARLGTMRIWRLKKALLKLESLSMMEDYSI